MKRLRTLMFVRIDHFQRYQGITRALLHKLSKLFQLHRGEVLMYEGKICDARFSKCCGGAMEEFQVLLGECEVILI